jgi:pimeloyl-ACP methyl ester carboxylesterase
MQTPILFLHGIRGSRLTTGSPPRIIWELACENHPESHLLALHPDAKGQLRADDPTQTIAPFDLEQTVYGRFLSAFQNSALHAPAYDWRLNPARAFEAIRPHLPKKDFHVVTHSMGMNLLAWALVNGEIDPERIRKIVLVTPPFGGSIDVLHILLNGADPEQAIETAHTYGLLVRAFPALYRLLPRPGYRLVLDASHSEPDILMSETWPPELLGEHFKYTEVFSRLLRDARKDRDDLLAFESLLEEKFQKDCIIFQAQGGRTPAQVRLDKQGQFEVLAVDDTGDGRLTSRASLPLRAQLVSRSFGSTSAPIPHGELLNQDEALKAIAEFLQSASQEG